MSQTPPLAMLSCGATWEVQQQQVPALARISYYCPRETMQLMALLVVLKSICQPPPTFHVELSSSCPESWQNLRPQRRDTIFTGLSTGVETSYSNTAWMLSAGKFLLRYLIDCAINSFLYHRIIPTVMLITILPVLWFKFTSAVRRV